MRISQLLIGASEHSYDNAGQNHLTMAGAAWLFELASGVWGQTAKFTPQGTSVRAAYDRFGDSVGLANGTALVGQNKTHTAFVFKYESSSWNQVARIDGWPYQNIVSGNIRTGGEFWLSGNGDSMILPLDY